MPTLPVTSALQMQATRLLKAARRPRFALRNLRYHVGLRPSPQAHIFVMGPPRSGTTLVMRLLNSHSSVTSIDVETNFFMRWNLLEYDMLRIRADLMTGASTSIELFDRIAAAQRIRAGARYFLEKTPEYALRISFLRKNFPCSKFIFVIRDGRDGFLSALRNPRLQFANVEAYAKLWKECVAARMRHKEAMNVLDIRYEDLCEKPLAALSSAMAFLGEPLEADQLRPSLYGETAIKQKPGHERLGHPISSRTVGEWRTRLAASEVRCFNAVAGRELRSMGYET